MKPDPLPQLPADPTLSLRPASDERSMETLDLIKAQAGRHWVSDTTPTPESPEGYELRRLIGRGGMGEVWEAIQVSLGRLVAVKQVAPRGDDQPGDTAARERAFRQEAMIAARLEHPNIVPVHDLESARSGNLLMAMKRVSGRSWDEVLRLEFDTLGVDEFLSRHLPVLIQVAQAVAFAHSRGVVHRDIKPGQVMLGEFGEVLLMDWGLALLAGRVPSDDETIPGISKVLPTQESASNPAGTPALMAPEQTEDSARRIGPWTDVFLLGATLYYILTGTYPHSADTTAQAFKLAMECHIEDPQARAGSRRVPPELAALCLHAMHREPQHRLASAREFVARLQDHLSGATRMKESTAITAGVRERLDSGTTEYQVFAQCVEKLGDAARLWPLNPEIPALRHQAHTAYARAALASRDLVLARLQAGSIVPGEERSAILREIDEAEADAARVVHTRRLAVRTAFALLLILLAGGTAFTAALVRSRAAERLQRQAAEKQRDATALARDLALQSQQSSDDLIAFWMRDLHDRLDELDQLDVLDKVVARSVDHYRKLPYEQMGTKEIARALTALNQSAELYSSRGNIELARSTAGFTASLVERHPDVLKDPAGALESAKQYILRAQLSYSENHADEGLPLLDKAQSILDPLVEGPNASWEAFHTLCALHLSRAGAAVQRGDLKASLKSYEEALAAARRCPPSEESRATMAAEQSKILRQHALTCSRLANEECWRADLAQARAVLDSAGDDTGPEGQRLRVERVRLIQAEGSRLIHLGKVDEGIALLGQALELGRGLVHDFPAKLTYRSYLVESAIETAQALGNAQKLSEATPYIQEAITQSQFLTARDPDNKQWQSAYSVALNDLGGNLEGLGKTDAAMQQYKDNLKICSELATRFPQTPVFLRGLSVTCNRMASILSRKGDFQGALDEVREGMRALQQALASAPEDKGLLYDTVVSRGWEAGMLSSLGRHEESLKTLDEAVATLDRLRRMDPANVRWMRTQLQYLVNQRTTLGMMGRNAEGLELQHRAVALAKGLLDLNPGNPTARGEYAQALVDEAGLLRSVGRTADALDQMRDGCNRLHEACEDASSSLRLQNLSCKAHTQFASALFEAGRREEGLAAAGLAVEAGEALNKDPGDRSYATILGDALGKRSSFLRTLGRIDDALADATRAIALATDPAFLARGVDEDQVSVALAHDARALALQCAGRLHEAARDLDTAADRLDALLGKAPGNPHYLRERAINALHKAQVLEAMGKGPEAGALFSAALDYLNRAATQARGGSNFKLEGAWAETYQVGHELVAGEFPTVIRHGAELEARIAELQKDGKLAAMPAALQRLRAARATALLRAGEADQARGVIETAMADPLTSTTAALRLVHGDVLAAAGSRNEAAAEWQKGVEQLEAAPGADADVELISLRARLQRRLERIPEATALEKRLSATDFRRVDDPVQREKPDE